MARNIKNLPPIRPLLGDKSPRWTENGSCGCDLCQHWSPLIVHLRAQLNKEGNDLLTELIEDWELTSEELDVANAKLSGDWPGWQAMKKFLPKSV